MVQDEHADPVRFVHQQARFLSATLSWTLTALPLKYTMTPKLDLARRTESRESRLSLTSLQKSDEPGFLMGYLSLLLQYCIKAPVKEVCV